MDQLRIEGVTTLATWETRDMTAGDIKAPTSDISAILDNLILLRQFEENHRLFRSISIQKMRDSDFDAATRTLGFAKGGLVIGEPLSSGVAPSSSQPMNG